YESEDWMVVCHTQDGRITEADFAASVPARNSAFVQQMQTLRTPLHLPLHENALPEWPELLQFHRSAGHGSLYLLPLVFGERNLGVVGLAFRQHEPLRSELAELLIALVQQVTLALALKRLFYTAKQSAVLAERNRIGREIHDGLAQAFTGIL